MSHISSGAIVKIERDGAITLLTGAADIGQGAETVISQIAAEELGVSLEDIRITAADTEITPLDPGTFGSGVTLRAGNAAQMAARPQKRNSSRLWPKRWKLRSKNWRRRDRRIFIKGNPERGSQLPGGNQDLSIFGSSHAHHRPRVLTTLPPKSPQPCSKRTEIFLRRIPS